MPKLNASAFLRCKPHHAAGTGKTLPGLGAQQDPSARHPRYHASLIRCQTMQTEGTDQLDGDDMARLASGNDAALASIMGRHQDRLFHYLLRQLNNESDAAELAQEAFVRVYQNRSK